MRKHVNTLFVTLEGAYLRKNGAAIEIRHEGETKLRVPLHNLDGIACFGWDISCSAALMAATGSSAAFGGGCVRMVGRHGFSFAAGKCRRALS